MADNTPSRILYLMQAGQLDNALNLYRRYQQDLGHHDFELLEHIALSLLDQGYKTRNPEIQLLTLYGAGISTNERALYILQEGITSSVPEHQIVCLSFLSQYHNDVADEYLNKAMASPFLLIRMEAAFHMCKKKHARAVPQTEALMSKVDPELHPLFPQLFALVGTDEAIRVLRRLMASPDEAVRIEAILCAAESQRDDLLPKIRLLATHHDLVQQEACAHALGAMKDESSVGKLEKMSRSPASCVRLAALQALYKLGRKESAKEIEEMAQAGDAFAIEVLGEVEESKDLLARLCRSSNLQIRINAALSLLEHRDARCFAVLSEILLKDSRDLGFIRTSSPGKALAAWKVVPSSKQNWQDNPVAPELSLSMREETLIKALELPEREFLELANLIFERNQNDLVPVLTDLLQNHQTPAAIALLKKHQQKAGAPLIRNYCNLALFLMKEPGPWNANLQSWIEKQQDVDLIRFRTFLPWEVREAEVESHYQLTPEDTSRLLVESFEAFASMQDDKGIDILLNAIQNGNPNNKYALAGLLMRAVQ